MHIAFVAQTWKERKKKEVGPGQQLSLGRSHRSKQWKKSVRARSWNPPSIEDNWSLCFWPFFFVLLVSYTHPFFPVTLSLVWICLIFSFSVMKMDVWTVKFLGVCAKNNQWYFFPPLRLATPLGMCNLIPLVLLFVFFFNKQDKQTKH